MLRLIYKVIFSTDAESRYQAAKRLYWRLPIPSAVKQKTRYLLSRYLGFMHVRSKAAAARIGRDVEIKYEVSSNAALRRSISRKPDKAIYRTLVVSTWIPEPDRNSGSVRLFAILEILAQKGHVITFASLADQEHHQINAGQTGSFAQNQQKLARLCADVIYGRESIGRHLSETGYRYQNVCLSFPDVAYELLPTVRAYCIHANVIYDTVDLHGLRMRREAQVTNDPFLEERAGYYEKIERNCAVNSDCIIAITEEEKQQLMQVCDFGKIQVLPNIHSIKKSNVEFHDRKGLLFIGNYQHTPNHDAVIYFVNEVLPIIRQSVPDIFFTVLGSDVTPEVNKLQGENVRIIGYVDDPEPYFSSHRVFVAPLRYGAGMKGKIGQSMSFGLPLVSTSIGVEGMGLQDGQHILIADDATEFAYAVIGLYTDKDLWDSLSERGLAFIEENYSYATAASAIEKIFRGSAADAKNNRNTGA